MLKPDERHLFVDALRPPTGWRLDAAVATTYTLDINSLLLAPLSMAAYDHADGGIDGAAPHELLEAIRRYAERTTVFCQAGGIVVPGTYRKLTVFAEESVIEVAPPPGRVFHPKLWLLRFTNVAGDYLHRFSCLSRNLTGDRSWDTVLTTDEAAQAMNGMSAQPLARFFEDLLASTVRPMAASREALLRDMAETVRDRVFEVPPPFTAGELFPIGTSEGRDWPVPEAADRSVVISPFLDAGTVKRLPRQTAIVSRAETFDRLGARALSGHDLHVLQPHADAPPDDVGDAVDESGDRAGEVKSGLHAKVLAWDIGTTGHLLTGSANATSAAFDGNIEFGVLLHGPASRCGVAAIMKDSDNEIGLPRILQPHVPSDDPVPDLTYDLERQIEQLHAALAERNPTFVVNEGTDGYVVAFRIDAGPLLGETSIRPVTLKEGYDRRLGTNNTWTGLGHSDLTEFVAVRTSLSLDGVEVERTSALRAVLVGAPDDRARRVLRELLSRVEDILRYLALLLRDPGIDDIADALLDATNDEPGDPDGSARPAWLDDLVMVEPLVRAFARNDGSLDRVRHLLDDLRDDEGALPDLGPDFERLWQVVSNAQEAR
ncbi:hypothetical protein F0U44_12205 [Nocardioides humilatus]|uniref:PLD phosphodiesterase domain-containing protein n=1 Tax=Nocardioides humilatus TaxID=2607660 RepID=A0A5B1LHW3_9ACTN|nr:phospholipase D family protein [Nocardioides humilatus]KAA1419207.1 hypothetical protein F0U44_12205 [Nocardioides humilatus]